jgi:hypothetical protein
MRSVLGVLGVMALAGVAGAALAQPSPQPFSLVYVGPASCPPEAEFVRRLSARLGASRATESVPRALEVRIAQADGPFVGRLSLIEADGRSTAKTLNGRDCNDLVDALALVAALALQGDDAALHDERPAPAASVAPPQPPARRVESDQAPGGSRFGAAIGGLVAAGPAPAVILGGTAAVDWAWVTASPLSPAFGLGAVAGAAPDVTRAGGRASFMWVAARVDACAVRLVVNEALQVRGCFLADIGFVYARGGDTVNPTSRTRGWLSLGASSQFEFPVGARFALQLVASVEAPLRRDRYAFGSADFFEVPVLIGTGSVGVVTHFR